jgi:hypothetical protein
MEKSFVTGAWQQTRAFSPAVITKGDVNDTRSWCMENLTCCVN